MVINTDKYQDKVCKRYLYHYLSAYNVTIQNWRIDYHVSFPYLRAKLKT